jgi:hypothetical protein
VEGADQETMKNERIITHFQSYTTAKGCVKDLTPHFKERISILTPQSDAQGGQTPAADDRDDLTKLADGGMGAAQTMIADLSEIGGVALGTVAYLYPGLSPILTGGPIAGDAIGQSIGSYLLAELGQNFGVQEDRPGASPSAGGSSTMVGTAESAGGNGALAGTPENAESNGALAGTVSFADQGGGDDKRSVFVAVDVRTEHEAMIAERIMLQYGGEPHRASSGDHAGEFPSFDTLPANPGVESPFSFARQDDGIPSTTIPAANRNPALEGYPLDPIAPLTPQGFIDPNIGLGDYNLADPNATLGLPPRE